MNMSKFDSENICYSYYAELSDYRMQKKANSINFILDWLKYLEQNNQAKGSDARIVVEVSSHNKATAIISKYCKLCSS